MGSPSPTSIVISFIWVMKLLSKKGSCSLMMYFSGKTNPTNENSFEDAAETGLGHLWPYFLPHCGDICQKP